MKKLMVVLVVSIKISASISYAGFGSGDEGVCWPQNAAGACDAISNLPAAKGAGDKKPGESCGERFVITSNGSVKRETCGAFKIIGGLDE
jgi:hypothetical protein